jgi:hypothetical protein
MIPSNRLTTHDSRRIDFPEVLAFHSLLSPFVVVWPRVGAGRSVPRGRPRLNSLNSRTAGSSRTVPHPDRSMS